MGNDTTVVTNAGKEIKTPIGKLTITQTPYFKETAYEGMDLYVSRTGLLACITNCKTR